MSAKPVKVGQGTFGQVIVENQHEVRKVYEELRYTVQETMVLLYMRGSKYIVKINAFNMKIPSITTERWSSSLREVMMENTLTHQQKMHIFKCVLSGLSHMHQVGVLQSDLKLSNILVNKKTYDACICDLGLSSLINYAKIHQTAKGYRPKNPKFTIGHDMFGLCVSMIDLFSGEKLWGVQSASKLRETIRRLDIRPNMKNALISMCPDDPADSATADEILGKLFGIKTLFEAPEIVIHENTLSDSKIRYLKETTEALTIHYKVNRGVRCYECLVNFFNSEEGREIDVKHWKLYVSATIFVYSSLFGTSMFRESIAIECLRGMYTMTDLECALDALLSDDNFVNMTMKA